MPDCFISYSSHDERLAYLVHEELARHGISSFLASASLQPGQRWSPTILQNLRVSPWVLVLASRAAATSAFVNQETGAALSDSSKTLVPIVWDMGPTELPGWLGRFQALDLRNSSIADLQRRVAVIAGRIKDQKKKGWLILGALVGGMLLLIASDKG